MVAQVLVKAALTAASIGIGMMRRIEGPRVQDLTVTTGDYGAPLSRIWGTRWTRPPIIWATDLIEVKVERKTKGGKFNDYTYYGKWGHALACHPLAAVRRIKMDGHLVLDLSGAGPVSPFGLSSSGSAAMLRHLGAIKGFGGSFANYFTFHPGTLDQGVDSHIAADVEAQHGEGSCPAYIGRALGVFHGVPLEKFGNRIPQVEFELVSVASGALPSEHFTPAVAIGFNKWRLSPDGSRLAWISGAAWAIWDVAARAEMTSGVLPFDTVGSGAMGVFNDGRMLYADLFGGDLYTMSPDGGNTLMFNANAATNGQSGGFVVADGDGTEHWGGYPSSFFTESVFDNTMIDFGWQVRHAFADGDGNVWLCGNAGATLHFRRMTTLATSLPDAFSVVMPGDPGGAVYAVGGEAVFLTYWGGVLYLVDPVTATRTTAATVPGTSTQGVASAFANVRTGATSIWLVNCEYEIETGQLLRTVALPADPGIRRALYSNVLHALLTTDNGLTIYYLDRLTVDGVPLAEIVTDICALAGIPADQIDVSLLTQTVPGYSVTSGTARDWLEVLLEIYDIDVRPHGFVLQFVPRGGAAGATIDSDDFARADSDGPLFVATGPGSTDLPRQVALQFADLATEQQPNAAMGPPRFESDGERVQVIDMGTLALSASTARQLVNRFDRRQRFDAHTYTLALPASQLALEPADVRPLNLRGVPVLARLHSLALDADRRIATEWKRDDPKVALLDGSTGAEAEGHVPAEVSVTRISRGFVLDVPFLTDSDAAANPLVYVLAAPWADGPWTGATVFEAIDGEYSDEVASVPSTAAAAWGYATTVLPDALATVWDRASVVNVRLQTGALAGCTEADIDANPRRNLLLIGAEIVNFTVAALQGDGSYNLSGFKRGRRGTEQHTAGHAVRDVVLLLDTAQTVPFGLSELGQAKSFKAVTEGRTLDGSLPIALTFTGASLKPLSPVHLRGARDAGSGDWALGWVRRTRVGGGWTNGSGTPLSEASEAYEVEILDGATVKRTITGLTTPAATYTAAQQTADWGAPQTTVTFRVYQISDAVDRGFAALATA